MLRRPIVFVPLLGFLLLALGFAIYLDRGVNGRMAFQHPASGWMDRPAPPLRLPALAGVPRPGLEDGLPEGQVVLVNFFASWCVPCRAEHKMLMRLAAEGVTIYGVAYRDPPADTRAFLAARGIPYARIGTDADGAAARAWGVEESGVPATFVFGKDGRVRYRQVGPIMDDQWTATIGPLVRKLAAATP